MHRSQRFGYLAYPLVLFIFLAAHKLIAQNSTSAPPAAQQQTQQPSENPQADQIRLAQQAQARIQARRQEVVQKRVEDTYSHKFEVYGGGGYLRFRPGSYLQQTTEANWNVGFTDYFHGPLGVTGDIRGYYGKAFVGLNPYNIFEPTISQYTFMAGPQYRIVRRQHWGIGAQLLAGAAKGIFNGNNAQFPGTLIGLWANGTNLIVSAGVPIDYNLGPTLAVRIMPNYLLTTYGGSTQIKNLGFTSGLVFRFGRQ